MLRSATHLKASPKIISRTKQIVGGAVFALLFCSDGSAQATKTEAPSRCNAAAAEAISYVSLPGHPFSTIPSKDGCWLFVSVTSSSPKSANGVALLRRLDGRITLQKVFPVEASPTGMVITHDGKLLIVADDEYVVFMDVMRMISGRGDPVLGIRFFITTIIRVFDGDWTKTFNLERAFQFKATPVNASPSPSPGGEFPRKSSRIESVNRYCESTWTVGRVTPCAPQNANRRVGLATTARTE